MRPLGSTATQTSSYGFGVDTDLNVEDAEQRVRDLLRQEGFGVLTEIDVQKTLKEKLGVEFRRYRILGACNPPLAHRALSAEPGVGLLLPCNVVIEEHDAGSRVIFLDPIAALGIVGNPELAPLAEEAGERLRRVAQAMAR